MYAWEPVFEKILHSKRNSELRALRLANVLSAMSDVVWFMSPYMVC